jgi:MSHA biogenesis protein MshJ
MKKIWETQAQRINALSLRERVIMFASVCVVLVALVDSLVFSPSMAELRKLSAQLREQTQQLDTLRAQVSSDSPENSPQGQQRAALRAVRDQLSAVDAAIREQLAGRDEIARLPVLLDRLLQRHERLAITSLTTVADLPKSADSLLRWQAVDLSVTGTYADLTSYLADLEASLPGLRWGPLQLTAASQPPVLTVRLMLPGDAP